VTTHDPWQEWAQAHGFTFHDPALLQEALTHRSYVNEVRKSDPHARHNERLEFLGDAVLAFVVGAWLYKILPHEREGRLSRLRSLLVQGETLAKFARACGLADLLRLGAGEDKGGGRTRVSILADAFEAVVGALYLDQGLEAVKAFLAPFLWLALQDALHQVSTKDDKTRLQEWFQAQGQIPTYHILWADGQDHQKLFLVEVRVNDVPLGWGNAGRKQKAQQVAAQMALKSLGIAHDAAD
jgi:ribonuclease-3